MQAEASERDATVAGSPPGLARALEAWASRVRENREQVDRFREVPDGADFYAPVTSLFRADPDRSGDAQLEALLAVARPDETWLDIGAGAGRFALPLARRVRRVIAIDPSEGMLAGLREAMAEHGIANIEVRMGRWPAAWEEVGPDAPDADVALMAHVGYDIEAIGPFVEAMEAAVSRLCVALLMDRQPSSSADPFWPPIHGESRIALPGWHEFVELLRLRGRSPQVDVVPRERRAFESLEQIETFVRRQLWVEPGGAKDRRLHEIAPQVARHEAAGWYLEAADPDVAVVTWVPRGPARRATSPGASPKPG